MPQIVVAGDVREIDLLPGLHVTRPAPLQVYSVMRLYPVAVFTPQSTVMIPEIAVYIAHRAASHDALATRPGFCGGQLASSCAACAKDIIMNAAIIPIAAIVINRFIVDLLSHF